MAQILDGKLVAQKTRERLRREVAELAEEGIVPGLAVVLVGNDVGSQVYVRNKTRACEELGIRSWQYNLPEDTAQAALLELIEKLNADPEVHGILVQMPLPKHIDEKAIIDAIDPKKDVDGSHPENMGRLFMNEPQALPCTPRGIMELLKEYDIDVRGQEVVIVGRSNLVGRPLAALMINSSATVTVAHSVTHDLQSVTKKADILVAAVGKAKMFNKDYIKEGAVVIDVGINRTAEGKLCGDVDAKDVMGKAAFLTPVPGGVGPMTVAMLMKQTVEFAERSVANV